MILWFIERARRQHRDGDGETSRCFCDRATGEWEDLTADGDV
jgi:hypothetical protein